MNDPREIITEMYEDLKMEEYMPDFDFGRDYDEQMDLDFAAAEARHLEEPDDDTEEDEEDDEDYTDEGWEDEDT